MKKITILTLFSAFIQYLSADAQWCVPNTAIPYNSNMPGITHVVLNTIDRISSDDEHYPNNNYTNTGLMTELNPGETYTISITYTIDPQICPDMNLRVWIDYNHDYQLDDPGETVISVNNQLPGTYTGTFMVPSNVVSGTTRMRVTAKMTPNGGHTLPTPCDQPADPFGYHGEIEDYDVVINSATGVQEAATQSSFNAMVRGNTISFNFSTTESSVCALKLVDLQGKLIREIIGSRMMAAGNYSFDLNAGEENIQRGIYLAILTSNEHKQVARVVLN